MNQGKIMDVCGSEVLDSRGNPTVEVWVRLSNGIIGKGIAPSGASTGMYEAVELRDGDRDRYHGKGVLEAVSHVNDPIREALLGMDIWDISGIDHTMIRLDGTSNKSKMGANATLAVSIACCDAAAQYFAIPMHMFLGGVFGNQLPVPMMNIINGGKHAKNNLDFQEFMIIPMGCCFRERLRMGTEVYHKLRNVLNEKGLSTGVGDEGGFAPEISDAREVFRLITEAVKAAGYEPGTDILYAMDAAASELYSPDGGHYYFEGESRVKCGCIDEPLQPDTLCAKVTRTSKEMIDLYEDLVNEFPLISIEDGLDQKDWEGWKEMTERLGDRVQLVGDDLFVTNPERFREGIKKGCANAILIKPNQIGTVSETLETIHLAKEHGYKTIISHRSGETEDTFIADLSVAVNAGQIKTGAPCRSERVAKYNRLLQIEDMLKNHKKP